MTLFGSIIGPFNIESAVIAQLRIWLPTYLAEVERQNGLPKQTLGRPPAPESYHGGLDWLSAKQDRHAAIKIVTGYVVPGECSAKPILDRYDFLG